MTKQQLGEVGALPEFQKVDNPFLPEGYEVPNAESGYMRLNQGENRFRVVGSAIVGWEAWIDTDEGGRKPKHYQNKADIKEADYKHFWAFPVYNYQEERVHILEITQKGIMNSIKALVSDEDWGDPRSYDIVITRKGEGLDTEYQVQPKPAKPLESDIQDYVDSVVENINLNALFEGEDPFNTDSDDFEIPNNF